MARKGYITLFHELARKGRTIDNVLPFARIMFECHQFSLFNSALAYLQKPGLVYIQTAKQWEKEGRYVWPEASSIICLQMSGPIGVYYDISDTYGQEHWATKPMDWGDKIKAPEVSDDMLPFFQAILQDLHISYSEADMGPMIRGQSESLNPPEKVWIPQGRGREAKQVAQYRLHKVVCNKSLDGAKKVTTIAHEMGHILCGHLPVLPEYVEKSKKEAPYKVPYKLTATAPESEKGDSEEGDSKEQTKEEEKQAEIFSKYIFNLLGCGYDPSGYLLDYGISKEDMNLEGMELATVCDAVDTFLKVCR